MRKKFSDSEIASRREKFEYWIINIDDYLDDFLSQFDTSTRKKLDFSLSSLYVLENWILDKYPGIEELKKDSEAQNLTKIGQYIRETFRNNISSLKWRIQLEEPQGLFYGLPILVDSNCSNTIPICPLTLGTASISRRTGKYIATVLENLIEDYKNDSD